MSTDNLTVNVIEEAPKWAAKIMANYLVLRSDNRATIAAMSRFLIEGKRGGDGAFAEAVKRGDFKSAISKADSNNRVVLELLRRQKEAFVDGYANAHESFEFHGQVFWKGFSQDCGTEVQKKDSDKASALYIWEKMFE